MMSSSVQDYFLPSDGKLRHRPKIRNDSSCHKCWCAWGCSEWSNTPHAKKREDGVFFRLSKIKNMRQTLNVCSPARALCSKLCGRHYGWWHSHDLENENIKCDSVYLMHESFSLCCFHVWISKKKSFDWKEMIVFSFQMQHRCFVWIMKFKLHHMFIQKLVSFSFFSLFSVL